MCANRDCVRNPSTLSGSRRRYALLLFVSILTLMPGLARSQSCTISSAGVGFGTYNPLLANATIPLDGAGTITYRCNRRILVTITLSTGQSGSYANRQMGRMGPVVDALRYNLYLDAGRTAVWGDRSLGAGHYYSATARRNRTISVPIYGRVPSNQDISPGTYTDQVLLTIEY